MIGSWRIGKIVVIAAALGALAGVPKAWAQDALAGLSPVGSSVLNSATTGVGLSNASSTNNSASVSGNTISVGKNSELVNGTINGNTVANNNGVTSVMMNSGNNVNFNNSMIVNVITPTH